MFINKFVCIRLDSMCTGKQKVSDFCIELCQSQYIVIMSFKKRGTKISFLLYLQK